MQNQEQPPSKQERKESGQDARSPVVQARFAVGEQVELKGLKFYVWQIDPRAQAVALVQWDVARRVKAMQRAEAEARKKGSRSLLYKPNGGRF